MRPKVRAMLDQLDAFFIDEEHADTKVLWDVLSALRGPDNDVQSDLKNTSTIPIRTAAFPRLARLEHSKYRELYRELDTASFKTTAIFGNGTERFHQPDVVDHFTAHLRRAQKALDLHDETPCDRPVIRKVDFGRGPVWVTLTSAGDVPIIRFRDKGRREYFALPLAAVYVQAVGRAVARRKEKP
jgi:hypothetical protein